jgi:hypothetical protein
MLSPLDIAWGEEGSECKSCRILDTLTCSSYIHHLVPILKSSSTILVDNDGVFDKMETLVLCSEAPSLVSPNKGRAR